MIRQIFILAMVSALLCGCVLQSRVPLYSDGDGQLILGETGGPAQMSDWRDGKWVADKDQLRISVTAKHYKAENITMTFVPLKDEWLVLQAVEEGKSAVYLLAQAKGWAVEVWPLACADVKKNAAFATWISYEGDDCFINPGAPAKELFAASLANPGHATSRLELLP